MPRGVHALPLALLAVVACRPKVTPQPDAATPIVDAAPPPLPTGPAFTLHSRFADNGPSIFPLENGIAVLETSGSIWKITTVGAGQKPTIVVPTRDWSKDKDSENHFRGEVWGTTDLAFLSLSSGNVLRGTPKGATLIPKHYRHVVELRDGQWLGLRSNSSDFISYMDSEPVHYELLAGRGDPIVVPSHLRSWNGSIARLSPGRFCASMLAFGESGPEDVVWTADIEGHQHIAPDKNAHWVFRGADGECWILRAGHGDPPRNVTIARVNGDTIGPAVAAVLKEVSRWQPRLDHEGGVWFVDETTGVPTRITIENSVARSTLYPLPEKVEGCDGPRVSEVVPLSATDVWVLGNCEKGKASEWMLFHTGAQEPIVAWPPL